MASTLLTLGKLLALIGGVLAVVFGVLGLLEMSLDFLGDIPGVSQSFGFGGDVLIDSIIGIVAGVLLIYVWTGKLKATGDDGLVLAIIVIVLGLVASSGIAILGGDLDPT